MLNAIKNHFKDYWKAYIVFAIFMAFMQLYGELLIDGYVIPVIESFIDYVTGGNHFE